jgi:hypothetical protein
MCPIPAKRTLWNWKFRRANLFIIYEKYAFCLIVKICLKNSQWKMHVGYSAFREVSTIDFFFFFFAVSIKLIAARWWNGLLSYIQLALNNFYVHGSVHRESVWIIVQRDTTIYSFISVNCSVYIFRVVTPPFIRSTYNCNQHLALVKPSLLPSAVVERPRLALVVPFPTRTATSSE